MLNVTGKERDQRGSAARVMLVDDEPAIAELVAELLAGSGCEVNRFSDPEEALRESSEEAHGRGPP